MRQVKKPAKKKKKVTPETDPYQRHRIKEGSKVKLISTKQTGVVEGIQAEMVTVLFGYMRMKVEREKLMWVQD